MRERGPAAVVSLGGEAGQRRPITGVVLASLSVRRVAAMGLASRVLVLFTLFWSSAVTNGGAGLAPTRAPHLPTGELASVELSLGGVLGSATEVRVASTDAALVEALASVIRAGVPAEEHKCRDTSSITFLLADGSSVRLGLLRGHGEGSYEVRSYGDGTCGVFRVRVSELENAARMMGVCTLDPGAGGQLDALAIPTR